MADEEKTEDLQEDEEKQKKSGKKGLKGLLASPIILVAIVLIAQGGIALMMVNLIGGNGAGSEGIGAEADRKWEESGSDSKDSPQEDRGKIISLDNMVVNLKENNKLYYLKLKVGLEIENSDMEEEIKAREPNLRDIIIEHISSRKVSDLDSREERTALKKELHMKINQALRTGDLIKLYFSQFVIQ
ncbi:MAG: hypothetical protein GF417_08535 [Candidatus Latescibacteria bacterium]|nr:hypothetical protein [bacterium]MBD3424468.1 hypothetical protein [Candidatus Latescibacterota bacterium]